MVFRAWAPGPATARAIERAATDAGYLDLSVHQPLPDALQFDSEALWAQVEWQVTPGFRLLVVRGNTNEAQVQPHALANLPGSGRDWLAQQCLLRGAQVDAVVAYERTLQRCDRPDVAPLLEQALNVPCWMFSNKESLQALAHLTPDHWAHKTALVTHPRIGEAALVMGFGSVQTIASGPEALSAALESSVC
jgi:uroporphyrinogen-III synthase